METFAYQVFQMRIYSQSNYTTNMNFNIAPEVRIKLLLRREVEDKSTGLI